MQIARLFHGFRLKAMTEKRNSNILFCSRNHSLTHTFSHFYTLTHIAHLLCVRVYNNVTQKTSFLENNKFECFENH